MKKIISDRHIVVVLFIVVFITFSFAQQDSKQLEEFHTTFRPLPVPERSSSLIIEKKKPENGFIQASVVKEEQN